MGITKKFKIKIRLNAIREDETLQPEPPLDLNQAVQNWWESSDGKSKLEDYLNKTVGKVKYKSFLHIFEAGDSVDKEAYD